MDDIDIQNRMKVHQLADGFIDAAPDDFVTDMGGWMAINQERLEVITTLIQDFVANVVAGLIDAGSERDAVNEAEDLHKAIYEELKGWSDHPDNRPASWTRNHITGALNEESPDPDWMNP